MQLRVQTRNSVYVVKQWENGVYTVLSSTNEKHQHIGCECDEPKVGNRLATMHYQNDGSGDRRLRACISSTILSITQEEPS